MSVLSSIKPAPWPLSPELTEAPELWRGCVRCYPFWEYGSDAIWDVSPNRSKAEVVNISAANNWGIDGMGPFFAFQRADSSYLRTKVIQGFTEIGLLFLTRPRSLASFHGLFGKGRGNNGSIGIFSNDGDQIQIGTGNPNTSRFENLSPNRWYKLGVSVSADGTVAHLIGDGRNDTASNGETISGNNIEAVLGALKNGVDDISFHGDWDVSLAIIYDRPISRDFFLKWANDPFAMLRPRSDL